MDFIMEANNTGRKEYEDKRCEQMVYKLAIVMVRLMSGCIPSTLETRVCPIAIFRAISTVDGLTKTVSSKIDRLVPDLIVLNQIWVT
jgi:hypothetical protein